MMNFLKNTFAWGLAVPSPQGRKPHCSYEKLGGLGLSVTGIPEAWCAVVMGSGGSRFVLLCSETSPPTSSYTHWVPGL